MSTLMLESAVEEPRLQKILEQLEMRVVFRSDSALVDVKDLDEQERQLVAKYLSETLKKEEERIQNALSEATQQISEEHEESVKILTELRERLEAFKENRSQKNYSRIMEIERLSIGNIVRSRKLGDGRHTHRILPIIYTDNRVRAKVTIAVREANILKYFGIVDCSDPLITIQGPDADVLIQEFKASL